MRAYELECVHGVGHSSDVHGCDGCCSIIAKAVEQRIVKLLEVELTRLSDIVDKGEYFDIPRIQFAMQILINLLNEIKGESQ
jgi:hypothetical protein